MVLFSINAVIAVIDPAAAIEQMQNQMQPIMQAASDWSVIVGVGLISAQAFYALIVRLIKM